MHREISHTEKPFYQETNLGLYLLTGLLGLLIGIDLWPALADWLATKGIALLTWPREFYPGYRIALLAAVLGGARVLYISLEGLLEGRVGADLAIALACVAAILFRKPLVAAEVVFIGMVGECLESVTFERTQRAIRTIVEICPRRCWLLRDGQEVRVLTPEVQVGDRVVVKPGGRVPVDGQVVEGRSNVDTSALTGESLPVDKGPGDPVLAGSLNQQGALVIEARRVREDTVAGQVIELTGRALKDKAPLERTADRLARYFLPVVLILAGLTFIVSLMLNLGSLGGVRRDLAEAMARSIDPTLAVLVVACPCALILATPAAIIAALGRLAGTGVLIKGGSSLERLAEVEAFAFDKTGTLTEGRLELGDRVTLGRVTPDELLRVAASAEQRSEHLLAQLLLREAQAQGLALEPLEEFQAHPGAGVTARTRTGSILVGTRRLLQEQGITLHPEAIVACDRLEAAGQTTLFVVRDQEILGIIGARDRVRPEAVGVLAELRSLGINDLALLTGDRAAVAEAIGREVGIAEIHAELLPQQKAEFIDSWRRQPAARGGRKVAMVGDGINDALALARADVGLALGGTGTDVAAEAGDLVLMGDPLQPIPLLVRLSRETVRIIKQNILIFAIGVNAVGIVLTGWLWPLLAPTPEWYEQAPLAGVIYHQIGSFAVLVNAMRLLWFERRLTSPSWLRAQESLHRLDHWLEHRFDLHAGWHWITDHGRLVVSLLILFLAAGYALSGVVQVNSDEVAVVRRFGRALNDDLGPGLYWRWPWPVEQVVRIQPDLIRTVEVGFRSTPGKQTVTSSLDWSSSHDAGYQRNPNETVMITGDGNLLELRATLRYTIDRQRLRTYLFEVREPETLLQGAAESVLRETVAGRPFIDLLTSGRSEFQDVVLARLDARCRQIGPEGLGIRLDGFALHDLHPPQEVVPQYHQVTEAMETRNRLINEAEAEILQVPGRLSDRLPGKPAALVRKQQILNQAQADTAAQVRNAQADRVRFLARQQVRSELSKEEEWELWAEASNSPRGSASFQSVYQEYLRRRQERVAARAALTDFRLFWEALGQALTDREKIIIDADKVPGRRHLLLVDPEQWRVPALIARPRGGRSGAQEEEP
jgi:Cu+-exporting ATPase